MKSYELEGLRGALQTISRQCSSDGSRKVEEQMTALQEKLGDLGRFLAKRVAVAEVYVKFHKMYIQVDKEMDVLLYQVSRKKRAIISIVQAK